MDEEILEDEAFNSEDERKYGDFVSGFMERKNRFSDDREDSEEEEEEGSEEDGPTTLLSDMLNGTNAADDGAKAAAEERKRRALLKTLRLDQHEDERTNAKERNAHWKDQDRSEVVPEGEFNLGGRSVRGSDGPLQLSDLLGTTTATADDAKLKRRLEKLQKEKILAEPVAPIIQARAERRTNYRSSKKQAGEWVPFVQANRKNDHLSFVALNQSQRQKLTIPAMVSSHKPTTEVEKTVQSLLEKSGLESERKVKEREQRDLLASAITPEQIVTRRKELQRMRALLTYAEQKNKRVKKIKSKLYRKIRKKKRMREASEQEKLLWETNPELAKKMQEREEQKRAKLRMTLKHRNQSKWLKKTLKRGGGSTVGSKAAVLEELRERELLHQKIMSRKNDKTVDDDDDDDDSDDLADDGKDESRDDLRAKAASLLDEIDGDAAETTQNKGLFAMKFMQRSLEKQRRRAREQTEELLRSFDNEGETAEKSSTERKQEEVVGRRVFGGDRSGKRRATPTSTTERADVEMAGSTHQIVDAQAHAGRTTSLATRSAIAVAPGPTPKKAPIDESNFAVPAFAGAVSLTTVSSEKTEAVNPWMASSQLKAKGRTRSKAHAENDVGGTDDVVDVAAAVDTLEREDAVVRTSNGAADDEAQQREIVQAAFAGAGVEEEFQKEKAAIIEREVDAQTKEEPDMVGWGSWAGEGVVVSKRAAQKKKRKDFARKRIREEKKRRVESSRKDAKLSNVILLEKRNKKAAAYAVKAVPFPFKSRAQYEQSLKRALGKELNTTRFVDRTTRPEVYTRAGVIITPASLPKARRRPARKFKG